jgi:hypothetical protein
VSIKASILIRLVLAKISSGISDHLNPTSPAALGPKSSVNSELFVSAST